MIGFLFPLGLLALGLVAIPIILHLFRPKRVQETPFSSLRWLQLSQHRIKRHIRWHQVLLLLLRVAFLTCLGLAMAKPIMSFERKGGTSDRFILVDIGRHMAYKSANESPPLETAFRMAERLASHVLAGDRTTVILVGRKPVLLGPLVSDATPYIQRMKAARAEQADAGIADTLRLVRTMVNSSDSRKRIDLYFITDNSVQDWSQGGVASFMEGMKAPVRAHVVEVGAALLENAWIADARLIPASATIPRRLSVRMSASGSRQKRTLRVADLQGIPELRQPVELEQGGTLTSDFEIPQDYDLGGKIARLEITPPDGLPADDVFWLNADAQWAVRALVIEPETTQIPELQPGFHLRTAMEALAASSGGSPAITRCPETAMLEPYLQNADLIFLVDVPSLTDTSIRLLENKVEDGGTLVIFAGPSTTVEFYNTRLHDPVRPAGSLSPVSLRRKTAARGPDGLDRVTGIDWTHPLFAGLFDPLYGDLAQTRFSAYFTADVVMPEKDRVLGRIADDAPWIVERTLGEGRVIFFNGTASDTWTDLPRRKNFVPFMDHLLRYTAGGGRRGSFEVGETAVLALPPRQITESSVELTGPSGQSLQARVVRTGDKAWAHVPELPEPGPYHLRLKGPDKTIEIPFAVNAAPGSTWNRMEAKTLLAWWAPAEMQVVKADAASSSSVLGGTRLALDPWLMFLACAVFIAEMLYTHRCCPRLNPTVVSESFVARRGFFAPTTPDETPSEGAETK